MDDRNRWDNHGRFIPDSTPLEVPLRFRRPEPLNELIKRLVRNELSQEAADQGEETFEEADDFDMEEEDPDMFSPYEMHDMELEPVGDYTIEPDHPSPGEPSPPSGESTGRPPGGATSPEREAPATPLAGTP